MEPQASLKPRLDEVIEEQRRRREARSTETDREMRRRAEREEGLGALWHQLFEALVAPKLGVLAAKLGHCGPLEQDAARCAALMSVERTEELPSTIRVGVSLSWSPADDSALLRFDVAIVPILGDMEREASLRVDVGAPDLNAISQFLDDRLVRFASDYGRLQDPGSPYQVGREVTDPVCLMSFTIPEAASRLTVGGKTYYFCSKACEARFTSR